MCAYEFVLESKGFYFIEKKLESMVLEKSISVSSITKLCDNVKKALNNNLVNPWTCVLWILYLVFDHSVHDWLYSSSAHVAPAWQGYWSLQ